jgi:hypothetical protein
MGTETCPSCGAALVASEEAALPGVTSVDPGALIRGRAEARGRSGGILGFLVGDDGVEVPSEAELERLAPPDSNVRLEIARLEIHAERQRLEASQAALAAEAAVKDGERAPERGVMSAALAGTADTPPPPGPEADPGGATPPPGPEA